MCSCFLLWANWNLNADFLFAAFCALAAPWEGFVIGALGAVASLSGVALLEKLKIDDPVGK